MNKTAFISPKNYLQYPYLLKLIVDKNMSLKQRVINLVTVLIFSYCLYSINNRAN